MGVVALPGFGYNEALQCWLLALQYWLLLLVKVTTKL